MGSTIRDIKIISKDINFELWPHKVDTDTGACARCPADCEYVLFPNGTMLARVYILNQFRWGSAVCCVCAKCFHYNYRQFQTFTVTPAVALLLAEMAI